MPASRIPRREFIGRSLTASASLLLLPDALCAMPNDPACDLTTRDLFGLGPFHEAGAPERMLLVGPSEPGQRLTISGVVTARDCTTPARDVIVDVWGANNAGCYTEIDASGQLTDSCTPRSSDPYNLRGRMRTDADGDYAFTTIVPGRYLNGAAYRPSHLHFLITPPIGGGLITQLYFEGDPYIPGDRSASDVGARNRIIPLTASDEGLSGRFNIVLDIDTPTDVSSDSSTYVDADAIVLVGANPTAGETTVRYELAQSCRADVMVFDATGRYVRTLVDAVHMRGRYAQRWDAMDAAGERVGAGAYVLRLRTSSNVVSVTVVII